MGKPKHTSSIEEINLNDLEKWVAMARQCNLDCPLLTQLESSAKTWRRLVRLEHCTREYKPLVLICTKFPFVHFM